VGDVEQHQLAAELKRHEDAVYTYFRRVGRQPADAADLTQDTFVRALVGVDRFRGDSTYRTWLLGIARNLHREWIRRSYRSPIPDDAIDIVDPGSDDTTAVTDALGLLPLDERELLVLHHVEGLQSKEIAMLLGISDAATRQRLSRAAAAFRKVWGER
jgi:RNA polymerase sigma-70 factor (ECF subfamily)